MSRRKRPPAPACARCGESLQVVGGRRIVATSEMGVLVCGPEVTLGEMHHPAQTARIGPKEYVVTYGTGWTEEARSAAESAASEGRRPWICQGCAGKTCQVCGAPLEHPIASTLLGDDGAVSHLMVVPNRVSCINPSCASVVQLR